MQLSFEEKLRIILRRRNMSVNDLADALGTSRQNLSNKLSRDNFREQEIIEILEVLNCTYKTTIIFNDTGEEL